MAPKTSTKVSSVPIVAAPVKSAPVKTAQAPKADKVEKVVAVKSAPKTAPVAAPVAALKAPVPDAASTVVDEVDDGAEQSLLQLVEKVAAALVQLREVQGLLKAHSKVFAKVRKISQKAERKRSAARKGTNGFTKAIKLSDELSDFLKEPRGVELARTEVTKRLTKYFKDNDLNNPANRREIFPDAALSKLLRLEAGKNFTFFNLQSHLKHHFIKAVPVVVVA